MVSTTRYFSVLMDYLPFSKRHSRRHTSFQRISERLILEIQLLMTLCLLPTFVQSYNESLGMSTLCKQFCDIHRSGGWRAAFQFDCDEQYDTYDERNNCRRRCNDCPDIICHLAKPDIFYCPSTVIENDLCNDRCNDNRPKGTLDGFTLNCNETYKGNAKERKACHQECAYCPDWVCDQKENENIWYCPIAQLNDKCEATCAKLRARALGSDTSDPFVVECEDLMDFQLTQDCTRNCHNCPMSICDPKTPTQYYCPSLSKPVALTTTTRRTTTEKTEPPYGGRCKSRCDKYRLGGTGAYKLQCVNIFKSWLERDACREDCETCPSKICYPGGSEGPIFDCPPADNHVEDYGRSMKTHKGKDKHDNGPIVAVGIAGGLAILFLLVGASYYYYVKRKRAHVTPVDPAHGPENPPPKGPNHSPDESTIDISVSEHRS